MSRDEQTSPDWLLKMYKGYFDPCPINPEFNGLEIEWKERNFVNPPYSKPKPWIEKAIRESNKGKFVVMLLPVDPTTEWYRLLFEYKAHIIMINERLKFNGSKTSARWGCILAILYKPCQEGK